MQSIVFYQFHKLLIIKCTVIFFLLNGKKEFFKRRQESQIIYSLQVIRKNENGYSGFGYAMQSLSGLIKIYTPYQEVCANTLRHRSPALQICKIAISNGSLASDWGIGSLKPGDESISYGLLVCRECFSFYNKRFVLFAFEAIDFLPANYAVFNSLLISWLSVDDNANNY